MTSSNVSNMLVQVKQIDVTVTSEKVSASGAAGLFEKTLKNVADNVPKAESNTDSVQKVNSGKNADSKGNSVDITKSTKEITKDQKAEEPEKALEELTEKVESVVEEVVEVIKEELDVTDDDIKLAMENLGLTFIDSLNPQNLGQLVAEITGETESIALILNEDFAGILDKVTELSNQLFEQTSKSFTEIKELISEMEPVVFDFEENQVQPEMTEIQEEAPTVKDETIPVITEEPVEKMVEPQTKVEKTLVNTEEPEVVETEEEPVVAIKAPEKENKENLDGDEGKKDNSFDFTKEPKLVKEPVERHDVATPIIQNEGPIFAAEQKVVTLPTGETVTAEDITNQIVEQARVLTDSESTTMELTLNPEGLGKIFLEVTQKGNEITAKIFTENDAVKNALESQMATLRTDMNQSSAKVTSIEVSVGTHEFERNLEDNQRNDSRREEQSREQSSKRSNRIDLNSLEGLTGMMSEEDILIAQMMQDNGGTLDFMA